MKAKLKIPAMFSGPLLCPMRKNVMVEGALSGEFMKVKLKIPAIVTADGRWSANGSCNLKEPDWAWLEEMIDIDWEHSIGLHRRIMIEAEVDVPEVVKAIKATKVVPT